MSGPGTRNLNRAIPRVTQPGNVEQCEGGQIRHEIDRLRGQGIGDSGAEQLTAAAQAWDNAADKLDRVKRTLKEVGEELAGAWSSEVSADSQRALMLMYDSADELVNKTHSVSRFTFAASGSLERAVSSFPSDSDPGRFEIAGQIVGGHALSPVPGVTNPVGQTVGGLYGRGLDAAADFFGMGEDPDQKYREALAQLNQAYVSDSLLMPTSVSAELPQVGRGYPAGRAGVCR